jgi:starch synthase
MTSALKVCFACSEVEPFAKSGGLGDVGAALPRALHRRGHDVRVFFPFHGVIDRGKHEFVPVDFLQQIPIRLDWRELTFSVWTARLPESDLSVYLVDCPELFHRPELYTSDADEPRRYAFFSRAVIESCQRMGWGPDLFHCHDWHTALIPLLLRTVYDWDALFHRARTVLTIHNIGYQGLFPAATIDELRLSAWTHLFDRDDLAAGRFNYLRTGLIYADLLTTVSPTYAREIQTADYGMGLDGLLRARRERLVGVLNGVNYDEWSPEKDRHIPHRYSRQRRAGKQKNKRYLVDRLQLEGRASAPVLGIVSRLVHQKGFDLCFPVLPELLATSDLRLAVLGTGEPRYEEFFQWLERRFPGRAVYHRGYDNELAHLIEAGTDMFLMPSRYEPCGLNQLFSLRYGNIPIVRRTGGLADSVELFDVDRNTGTGFVFDHFTPDALRWALDYALATWRNRPAWRRLMGNAMRQDFSWSTQADRYVELYRWLIAA